MFHWICPECGQECPPSSRDCPTCYPVAETAAVPVAASNGAHAQREMDSPPSAVAVLEEPEPAVPADLPIREGIEQLSLLRLAGSGPELSSPLLALSEAAEWESEEPEELDWVEADGLAPDLVAVEAPAVAEGLVEVPVEGVAEPVAAVPEPVEYSLNHESLKRWFGSGRDR